MTIEPADDKEIADTIAVMGGEDLEMWVAALADAELLAPEVTGCGIYLYWQCVNPGPFTEMALSAKQRMT